MGTATRAGVVTKTEPTFRRGRHLALAVAGLAHGPLTRETGAILLSLTHSVSWSAELSTLNATVNLCFAALVAWLAFVVFDTNSGITILPKRWRDVGVPLVAWCVILEIYSVVVVWRSPLDHLARAQWWIATFANGGELRFGWAIAALFAHAAAEEIVYRALLLRALEGYMPPPRALVVQAAVFELVHVFVYGSGFSGVPFVSGVILGHAFQRTRSLAVPTLLHAAHNILFFTLVWYFNP